MASVKPKTSKGTGADVKDGRVVRLHPEDGDGAAVCVTALVVAKPADVKRLRDAGFKPMVRWVDIQGRSDAPLKTIEALTLLDRRDEASKQQKRGQKGK